MPALFETNLLPAWQLLALAAVVVAAVAGSVYLARKHLASDAGLPDAVFWDGFAGLAVVAPAVIVASLASPWAGLMLGLLAAGTAGAAYRWTPRLFSWQEARRSARETLEANEAAAARHRSALARWQRYELDPGYCIDYPGMSDPARPETAALIRAMKAAQQLRGANDARYGPAVDRLERALAEAERAAGAPGFSTPSFSTPGFFPDTRHLSAEGTR
ncbi:hypothetical protein [Arthrobacter sp. UYEF20]|uniref:hypothetical protein n=1 Tax=Arthrobacter sp. UYEF20 TaxID=1756363 RepID=UPI00339AA84E